MPKGIPQKLTREEVSKKISNTLKGKMPKFIPNNKGRILSEEHKDKLRKLRIGKKHTEEWKNKMSKRMKGKKLPKEWRNNISKGLKGKPQPWNSGINSHLWKGGISFEPYSVDWTNTLKRSIRERDKYIC